MNNSQLIGICIIFLCFYFIIDEIIFIIFDANLKTETDYVLIQGFLKSPIFILEKNRQKTMVFRVESRSHIVFFKIEYNGPLEKGKYKEAELENLLIKPDKEYFIGANQKKYVYKKSHYIRSIIPVTIDFYDLKKLYFKANIKEKIIT